MKKWFPAFLFLSLSGCNDALAGWHNVMFYAFNDYSGYDSSNMTIFDRGQFTIPWKTGAASAIYSSCQTPEFVSGVYFQEYIAWVLVPRSTQTTDRYTVFFDVYSKYGWNQENTGDYGYYYFLNGYEWDTWTSDGGRVCAPVGNTKQLSNTFNELRFSLLLPADLPKGRYEVPIKYIRGIQHHYYNGWREHYKMPYSQVKQLPATNTLMLSFNNTGSCRPSAQSLEINHGNLSIDSAHGNYASQAVTIYCDVPVTVKISLFSNTQPAYNNQGVAVGLGNGWDSIIYLDGVKRNEETLRWNTAGSRTVTVGSKLYGEAGKITSGALSGSMTMIMHLP